MSTMWEVVKNGFFAQLECKAQVAISKKRIYHPGISHEKHM